MFPIFSLAGYRAASGNVGPERGQPGHLHHHLLRVRLAAHPSHPHSGADHGHRRRHSDEDARRPCDQGQEGAGEGRKGEDDLEL